MGGARVGTLAETRVNGWLTRLPQVVEGNYTANASHRSSTVSCKNAGLGGITQRVATCASLPDTQAPKVLYA
jgi:hypothetical protein